MSRIRFLGLAVLALALTLNGCGGRAARPVTVTQSFDTDMSCAQLASEIEANKVRINSLHKEDSDRHGRNAAMATGGVLLGGVGMLLFIDTGEAQEEEIRAYTARNNHLVQEAAKDGCTQDEMAAAVSANSAAAAAAATRGSTGAASTQVAVAPAPSAQASAAQAQFDSWYATNQEALRRAISAEVRDENLLKACSSKPTDPVTIEDTTVTGRDENGYRVNVDYTKKSLSGTCDESRNDAFLVRIENDSLAEVSFIGPATALPAVATAAAGAEAATGTSAGNSMAAAQTKFDAWYPGNTARFQQLLTQEVRDEALLRSCAAHTRPNHPVDVVDVTVIAEQSDGMVVKITYIKVGDNSTCDETRTDAFLLRIENDQPVELSHLGSAS